MRCDELVVMGYVRDAFGLHGWIKVHADTEYADSLFDYPVWWLGKDDRWVDYRCEECALHAKTIVAKLEGVEGRDSALALRGRQIAVPRNQLPKPGKDEYYWADLIGINVVNMAGQRLGVVVRLMATGANDVLVVQDERRERLIPFVAQYIGEVDLAARQLVVDWGIDY